MRLQLFQKIVLISAIANISVLLSVFFGIVFSDFYIGYLINRVNFSIYIFFYVLTAIISLIFFVLSVQKLIILKDITWRKIFVITFLPSIIFVTFLFFARAGISTFISSSLIFSTGSKIYSGDHLPNQTSNKKISEINPEQNLIIGSTTLEEVYELLSNKSATQLSFAQTRTKTIAEHTFEYDKILHYGYSPPRESVKTTTDNGTTIITEKPMGDSYWRLVIFFDANVISHVQYQHYAYDTGVVIGGKNTLLDDSYGWEDTNYVWPNASEDISAYKEERGL